MNSNEWRERQSKLPGRVERSNFMTRHFYKEGKLLATIHHTGQIELHAIKEIDNFNPTQIDEHFLHKYTGVVEKVEDTVAFTAARQAAMAERKQFWDDFKQDLFEYHGISDNPKRELFFNILQSQTKDIGEMIGTAEEWVDLLK